MKTYTILRNLFGTLTNNNSTANLTTGDQLINDAIRHIVTERSWDFVQKTSTALTVSTQQGYNLPYDYDVMIGVTVTVGTTIYTLREVPSRDFWTRLNMISFTSDFAEWFYVFNGQVLIYPTPSTGSNSIIMSYDRRMVDLTMADYTTGTVTVTNGSTTVTGSGTTWAASMAGRYIRIDMTNTNGGAGDEQWYQISSVTNTTTLVLVNAYQGTTVSVATTYTLGQLPIIPEAYQDLPVYMAALVYFSSIQPDTERMQMFEPLVEKMHNQLIKDHSSKTIDPGIEDADLMLVNPNLLLTL